MNLVLASPATHRQGVTKELMRQKHEGQKDDLQNVDGLPQSEAAPACQRRATFVNIRDLIFLSHIFLSHLLCSQQ